ncbi:hypothetical protein ASE00_15010 [Sphingomonas sp. Root710]|uniref:WcbI family polysaccharide biosynthesis putative acetyltransferase n=1 Tax=Sphingomonas sp. Root710 TaxID=1736594 RepID=UPI0006FECDF2|nr:WcbI family polysaccharide biosynthesis putative acetyltransferase [Sphingomonas sp. Root710]KRB81299.1 hypothetical protein ASE00_15010 [Sphingomonas sp. Root710]
MRIGIVGNCQSNVMARWLEQMLPGHTIVHHSIAKPAETYGPAARDLGNCDAIISQWIGPGHGPLESAVLRLSSPAFIQVPNLVFTGFQPDMVYLHDREGNVLPSPLGAYHSRIVAACFYLGLGPIRTKSLFNSYIYGQLGYFDEFAKARLNLDDALDGCGLPISTADLVEQGAFMHTINHANISANRLVTAAAVRKVGLTPLTDIEDISDELLEDTVWPIYPPVARQIGVGDGSMTYQRPAHMVGEGQPRELSLDQLIERSFEIYGRDKTIIDFDPVHNDGQIIKSAIKKKYN